MKYSSLKVSNIDDYLAHGVGSNGMSTVWEVHSVSPSMWKSEIGSGKTEVIQWLVVLKADAA